MEIGPVGATHSLSFDVSIAPVLSWQFHINKTEAVFNVQNYKDWQGDQMPLFASKYFVTRKKTETTKPITLDSPLKRVNGAAERTTDVKTDRTFHVWKLLRNCAINFQKDRGQIRNLVSIHVALKLRRKQNEIECCFWKCEQRRVTHVWVTVLLIKTSRKSKPFSCTSNDRLFFLKPTNTITDITTVLYNTPTLSFLQPWFKILSRKFVNVTWVRPQNFQGKIFE